METRGGLLVAGTNAGVAVLKARSEERSPSRFEVYCPGPLKSEREIKVMFEDRAGVLWCGTSTGLYRIRWTGSSPHFEAVLTCETYGARNCDGLRKSSAPDSNTWRRSNACGP